MILEKQELLVVVNLADFLSAALEGSLPIKVIDEVQCITKKLACFLSNKGMAASVGDHYHVHRC